MPMPEYMGILRHLQRYPIDGTERMLSKVLQVLGSWGGKNDLLDCDLRPWAYTDKEAEEARRMAREAVLKRRQDHIQNQLTKAYMGQLPGE